MEIAQPVLPDLPRACNCSQYILTLCGVVNAQVHGTATATHAGGSGRHAVHADRVLALWHRGHQGFQTATLRASVIIYLAQLSAWQ